jgi:hypothetical protein
VTDGKTCNDGGVENRVTCVECLALFSNRSRLYLIYNTTYLKLITPNRPFA